MTTRPHSSYGDLIRMDRSNGAEPEPLDRIPLDASTADGGLAESDIHELLYRFPGALPIAAIDASYKDAVPVCRELYTRAGYIDALYVNSLGRLMIAEFKLWRNPQARREVIGQILDYAKELASWRYADLQREVSRALKRTGNVLYDLVRAHAPAVSEAEFVDNVTRHLKRGEFLLLIVGDGIREDVEDIVGFVQRHSGLHFNLALVEAALYRDGTTHIIVQPRVLARTEIVHRGVVDDGSSHVLPTTAADDDDTLSDQQRENLRFWDAVLDDFSFSDVNVEVPVSSKESIVWVTVRGSGFGGYGLSFAGYIYRNRPHIGCYLSCRKGIEDAIRIYTEIEASVEDLRHELGDDGDDLENWTNPAGRPRIGFQRETRFPLPNDTDSQDFREAVAWMREHLDLLVSTLHPRLRRMIDASS